MNNTSRTATSGIGFAAIHRIFLLVAFMLCLGRHSLQAQVVTKLSTEQICNNALPHGGSVPVSLDATFGDGFTTFNGYQYTIYYTVVGNNYNNRYVTIARRQLPSSSWETCTFTDYVQTINDDHRIATIGVCPGDGTIHLSFDHHNNSLHYRISTLGLATNPSAHPWVTNNFGPVTSILPGNTTAAPYCTYPTFFPMPNGNLHFTYRQGSAASGKQWLFTYDQTTHTWNKGAIIINGDYDKYTDPNTGIPGSIGPYPHGWDYDSTGRLHLSWIWRAPGTLPADNFDIMYAYSDDEGATWYNSAGQLACTVSDGIGMHLNNNPPVKVMNYPEGTGLLNGQNRQCVDSHRRLHILQWNGSQAIHLYPNSSGVWTQQLLPAIAGTFKVDRNDNLYILTGTLEVYAASPANGYGAWPKAYDGSADGYVGSVLDNNYFALTGNLSTMTSKGNGLYSYEMKVGTGAGTPTQVRVETAADGSGTVVPAQTVPGGRTVTAYAITRDVNGNFVANVTPDSWSLVNQSGGVANSNLVTAGASATFTGGQVGSCNIHAAVAGLTSVDSGLLTVSPPPSGILTIETAADGSGALVGTQNITLGNKVTGYAIVRNSGGTFVANTNATWSLIHTTGRVVGTNLLVAGDNRSATFTGTFSGSCQIQAVASGSLAVGTTNSGTLTVLPGTATQVLVETAADGSGTVVPAQAIAGGGTVTGYAIKRDAFGNFVANATPDSWSLVNKTDGVVDGDLVASGASATFTGNLAGTANIHAAIAGLTSVDSGLITVNPDLPGFLFSDPADTTIASNAGNVPGITLDAPTNTTGTLGDTGSSPWANRCVVYVFQLPNWGAIPNPFTSASIHINITTNRNGVVNCDLYGLPCRATSTVLTNDYYGSAPNDTNATLIQSNILTSAQKFGVVTNSAVGVMNLMNYLNAQYKSGAGAGQWVFLRINTSGPKTAIANDYLTMAEGGVAGPPDTRPQINYTILPPNTAPTLAPMNDQAAIAGQTIIFTNSATDSDLPPQTLTYSLQDPPAGATINPTNGVFTWRPTIAQSAAGGQAYDITVVVTDNGVPPLSDENDFTTTVYPPQNPSLGTLSASNGLFNFTVNGDNGPDYTIYSSSNLVDWFPVWTNTAAVPPFTFTDSTTNASQRFYQVLLGP